MTGQPDTSVVAVVEKVGACGGELRAGGTDVTARQRIGRATGPFVDLRGVPELRASSAAPAARSGSGR